MKLTGCPTPGEVVSAFVLPRGSGEPLLLQLRPLSLGFLQRLRQRGIVPPAVPSKIARDSSGRPLRDAQGLVLSLANSQDPDYLQQADRYHQRVAVLSFHESVSGDQTVEFETPVPANNQPDAWCAFADDLFREMEAAGFTAGDLILLCREICRLSNLLDDQMHAAQANFSPSRPSDSS